MITLEDDTLVYRFPDVDEEATLSVALVKTLRVPDDGKDHHLPPGLARFPLRHVDDYADSLPERWLQRGGVVSPMYQCEALWLRFAAGRQRGGEAYPFAIKVATGKFNAITGEEWCGHLNQSPQDYVVAPEQPWLDGYSVENGKVRQFVAARLGDGFTVEEQLGGSAEVGGVQISVWPMKRERFREIAKRRGGNDSMVRYSKSICGDPAEMGLAPGGRIRQEIFRDPYGLDAWDQRHGSRVFISLLNSTQWLAATGERPPGRPIDANDYTRAGLPWFDFYGSDGQALEAAAQLGSLKSIREIGESTGRGIWPITEMMHKARIVDLSSRRRRMVRESEL